MNYSLKFHNRNTRSRNFAIQ